MFFDGGQLGYSTLSLMITIFLKWGLLHRSVEVSLVLICQTMVTRCAPSSYLIRGYRFCLWRVPIIYLPSNTPYACVSLWTIFKMINMKNNTRGILIHVITSKNLWYKIFFKKCIYLISRKILNTIKVYGNNNIMKMNTIFIYIPNIRLLGIKISLCSTFWRRIHISILVRFLRTCQFYLQFSINLHHDIGDWPRAASAFEPN